MIVDSFAEENGKLPLYLSTVAPDLIGFPVVAILMQQQFCPFYSGSKPVRENERFIELRGSNQAFSLICQIWCEELVWTRIYMKGE